MGRLVALSQTLQVLRPIHHTETDMQTRSSDCNPMTGTHIMKDKEDNLAYRMYFECPVVLK